MIRHTLAAILLFTLCSIASADEKQAPEPMDHTYVKLFTLVGSPAMSKASDETIEYIAKNYAWINSHGGGWLKKAEDMKRTSEKAPYFAGPSGGRDEKGRTVGERLRAINPDIILTNYRNGTPTSQHGLDEAMEVESGLPLSICVWPTGAQLTADLKADETTILLVAPKKPEPETRRARLQQQTEGANAGATTRPRWGNRPTTGATTQAAGQGRWGAREPMKLPDIYPFKPSSTDSEYTIDKEHYVSWLRLDDEIIRVNEVKKNADGHLEMTVQRGIWGTKAADHAADTVVYQPIYCGSARGEQMAEGLSGFPNAVCPQQSIRYLMMVAHPDMWEWLGVKSKEALDEGYNGPWYDCTCSMWINHSNAYGMRVEPYDFDKKQPLTQEDFREYHQRKLDYMFKTFPKGEFYVNWIFPQHYWDQGEDRLLLSGENGHHPISGGAVEMYGSNSHKWHDLYKMHRDMIDNKYRIVFWQKGGNGQEFIMFAYGTYLLAQEKDAPHCFGGHWTMSQSGQGPGANEGKHGAFTAPEFLFYDVGDPVEHFKTIEEAEMPGNKGVYWRHYSKGLVLVNPDNRESAQVELEEELYDVMKKEWVKSVKLEPRRAALLLK